MTLVMCWPLDRIDSAALCVTVLALTAIATIVVAAYGSGCRLRGFREGWASRGDYESEKGRE